MHLILVLVAHTYTIHSYICTVYIPILYLFYTCILYFLTVLHFDKKCMIQPPILHSLDRFPSYCLHNSELFKISFMFVITMM